MAFDPTQPQQPQGYNGVINPNYSYAQSFMPTVPMTSPTTGMTGMADALINGYSQYQQMHPAQAAGQLNSIGDMISGLFGGGGPYSGMDPNNLPMTSNGFVAGPT